MKGSIIMIIHEVSAPITVVHPKDYPSDGLPEFVFIGRSNVGKSSLLNTLIGRKNLAYTSQNPGKTQTLNFYQVNQSFYCVDVPGYGYAKVSKKQREAFGQMIETYLTQRMTLKHAFLLIDLRHNPTEDDVLMAQYLLHYQIPFTVIATKADKISNNQRLNHVNNIHKTLGLNVDVIPFSAVSKLNKDAVLEKISAFV